MGAEPLSHIVVEGCVTDLEEARACERAGADRVELCVDLSVGGLTPSKKLVDDVCRHLSIPVMAMIRPHAKTFQVCSETLQVMLKEMDELRDTDVAGFVFGALDKDNEVSLPHTRALVEAAAGRSVTFHRAFDETPDLMRSAERLIEAGVDRVLTGGGPNSAWDGRQTLKSLVSRFSSDLKILGGGSVRGDHVQSLVTETGLTEVHARASGIPAIRSQL